MNNHEFNYRTFTNISKLDQTMEVNEFKENNSHKLQCKFVKYKDFVREKQSNTYYAIYLASIKNTNNQNKR